ncbi:DUF1835 domain-containing protein [Ascidiimonas sp. W6]|uniref:DUF1835 domain-containing protein n=1 Tax=Ascidiimonas meishanensis TaxID=3128903 RepID=UPI0030ED073D
MSKVLHITNGDNFTSKLKEFDIKGDLITWREMLCEGRTITEVGSEKFWKVRFDFFNKVYKVTKRSFIDRTLKEYRSLCNYKMHDEIVLWFEYDLFCQINMIAVISWLKKYRNQTSISLICSGKEDSSGKLYGLAELSEDKLNEMYHNRIALSQDDIEFADYIWHLYCEENPIRMQSSAQFSSSTFKYLPDAIEAHLRRFPSVGNGLNELENIVLDLAATHKPKSQEELVKLALENQGIYGFGDLQFIQIIKELKPLFRSMKPVTLKKLAKELLQKSNNFYPIIRNTESYLGGAAKYDFLFNEPTGGLLKL